MIPNQISWCVVVLVQFILLLLKYAFEEDIDMWIVFIPAIVSCVVLTYDRVFRYFYAEYTPPVQMSTNQEAVEFVWRAWGTRAQLVGRLMVFTLSIVIFVGAFSFTPPFKGESNRFDTCEYCLFNVNDEVRCTLEESI